MAVSFVEDMGWWDESMQSSIAQWPAGLVEESENQRRASQ